MEEDSRRQNSWSFDRAKVAFTELVSLSDTISEKDTMVQEKQRKSVPQTKVIDYRKLKEHSVGSMPVLDQNFRAQGFDKSDIRFLRKA